MSMCPLCNGMSTIESECNSCHHFMVDKGRLLDFYDDYSAYLEIDGMKMFDGIANDKRDQQCPHVFYCENCHSEKTVLIQEE